MEGMPNRKERRRLAKEAGLIKKKSQMKWKDQLEISKRAREFGNQIHLSNTEKILRQDQEKSTNLEAQRITNLIANGISYEDAIKMIEKENENIF